jgi:hypothetical protein
MAKLRVRRSNAEKMCKALRLAGYGADWVAGARSTIDNGCSDPAHCIQHPEAQVRWYDENSAVAHMDPTVWATVITDASGNAAHRVWVDAGILK